MALLVAQNFKVEDRGYTTPCWIWLGATWNGYGRTTRSATAHIESYRDNVGSVPEGHELHHLCEVRLCVNHNHLLAVTKAEHRAIHQAGKPSRALGIRFTLTEQQRRDISKRNKGRRHTLEARAKMSASHMGSREKNLGRRKCKVPDCRRRPKAGQPCPEHGTQE